MQDKKVFYKAQEAQKRLGVDRNRFNYLVRTGQIKRVVLPGNKMGVYPVAEVEKLATLMDITIKLYNPQSITIQKATQEDLPEMVALGNGLMPEGSSPLEIVNAWIKRCPESIHVLKSGGEIVGYTVLLPFPEDILDKIMHRELRINKIDPNLVQDFIAGEPLHIYVRELIALPSKDKNIEAERGLSLIMHLASFIENLGNRGVKIAKLTALASSKEGKRTCEVIGFKQMDFIPDPNNKNIIPFVLDVKTSETIFATRYRENYSRFLENMQNKSQKTKERKPKR